MSGASVSTEFVRAIKTQLRTYSREFEATRREDPTKAAFTLQRQIEALAWTLDYRVVEAEKRHHREQERQRRELGLPQLSLVHGGRRG